MTKRTAIIIGAGPAGLTAAYELLTRTDIQPIILEQLDCVGGISRTVLHHGNRMDIGGHRFFSKVDRVMDWWFARMPIQGKPARDYKELGRKVPVSELPGAPDPDTEDRVMLVRDRLSRILFLRKFFDYPISLSFQTLSNLGIVRTAKIGVTYLWARLFPRKPEKSLEEFFINRFGAELYGTFFKDYTEKVWGIPCSGIKAEWGAQRIKGLSITKAVFHAAKKLFLVQSSARQKETETSLIEAFYYPKFGPGQMWETVAAEVTRMGGEIRLGQFVDAVELSDGEVRAVLVRDLVTGSQTRLEGEVFFSTMPIKELIVGLGESVPPRVRTVAEGLQYRDFITVGLLLRRLLVRNQTKTPTQSGLVPDNWIYIQESDVQLGRLQIFNNWSPYLVQDPDKVWLGLEYFCNEGDALWRLSDPDMMQLAKQELEKIGIALAEDVEDAVVIRVQKAYPAYFGTYDQLDEVRSFVDGIPNLFLVGRNGMHRYNNQDHSMLAAMTAVDNLIAGVRDRSNLWAVNTEEEYHEAKKADA
jgi:protoporphyrinogen oxidase